MSAVKNIVLLLLALVSVIIGAVTAYTVAIPSTPIEWAIVVTAFLLVLLPTLWLHGVVQYFHTKWTNWVDSNQRDDVPAVYTGYNLEAEKRKEFWENTNKAWQQTILDLTHAEVELRQKQDELARALARGARYKSRMECEMTALKELNAKLTEKLSFYRTMNWADKTHQRIVKK